jgi:hypothetical protein
VAADDEFESFRGAIADLDGDRRQRIRDRFETLRAAPATPDAPPDSEDDAAAVHLVPTADAGPPPRPRHRRSVLIGVAAIVVLVALVGAFALFRSDSTTDLASSVDDVPLSEIAARARTQRDSDLPTDQVLYLHKVTAASFAPSGVYGAFAQLITTDTWARRDGTGVVRTTTQIVPTGPGDAPSAGPADPALHPIASPQSFLGVRAYDEIRDLPTTPDDLLQLVRTSFVSPEDPTDAVQFLARLLALETTPPDVRAAGFEAIAQLGAEPAGRVTTFGGAQGTAYRGVDPAGQPWLIVVDPASTRVLAFVGGAEEGDQLFLGAERWEEFGEQRFESGLPS